MERNCVFIPGLFGGVPHTLLKDVEGNLGNKGCSIRVIPVVPGSLSSIHDRAVETFYQLHGGRADYGLQHSELHKHKRYGRYYKGLLPEWGADHPIDIVSYSLGSPTARYLQYLLITQAFRDDDGQLIPTNGDWIRSLITLMGTNNGSPLVHVLGLSFTTLEPLSYSILWIIYMIFYCAHWLLGPKLDFFFPVNLDHWECTWKEKSLFELLETLPGLSENAGKDLSPIRMFELNKEMSAYLPHSNTFYLACVASNTGSFLWSGESSFHLPNLNLISKFPGSFLMILCGTLIGLFGSLVHRYSGLAHGMAGGVLLADQEGDHVRKLELLHHQHKTQVSNDGMVNVAGQRHPYFEKAASVEPVVSLNDFPENIGKGIWHHLHLTNWSHHEPMKAGKRQAQFIQELLQFLHEKA